MAIVYRYGLLAPTQGAELVEEQLGLAHRYRNRLCELERKRRLLVRAAAADHLDMRRFEAAVAELEAKIEQAQRSIRAERAKSRRRSEAAGARAWVKEIKAYLRGVRAAGRAARASVRADPEVKRLLEVVERAHAEAARQARASSGLYWGTYLVVEAAADDARQAKHGEPAFRRWDGSGSVAVQLQKGMSLEKALSCRDARFQIQTTPEPVPGRGGKPLGRVRLRVGSDGRKPIWAEWPVVMHRPLPEDATIMWARVRRVRVATKFRWHLLITVQTERKQERCGTGVVAVDLGWRQMDDGVRVAFWGNDRGQTGELRIDPAITSGQRKADDLQAIRKKNFNEALARVRQALAEMKRADMAIPWLTEATRTIHAWRAERRLAHLAIQWRSQRFAGDEATFDALEAWRKQDRHLYEWEANQRRKSLARRLDQYRRFAAMLARDHHTVVLERFDLRVFAERQPAESERVDIQTARTQRHAAAVSELRLSIVQAFLARNGRERRVSAVDTTRACHQCGLKEKWDAARHLYHACSGCGAYWDQDDNAWRNMLVRLREQPDDEPARTNDATPIAGDKPRGRWQRRRARKAA